MRYILITSLAIILIVLSCKKDDTTIAQLPLENTKWTLSYIQDTKTNTTINYPSDAKNNIFILFSDTINNIYFDGVCNGGIGQYNYSIDDGSINITSISNTRIFCKYSEWEDYVTTNLHDAFLYKINGNNLEIKSKGTYNLFFKGSI